MAEGVCPSIFPKPSPEGSGLRATARSHPAFHGQLKDSTSLDTARGRYARTGLRDHHAIPARRILTRPMKWHGREVRSGRTPSNKCRLRWLTSSGMTPERETEDTSAGRYPFTPHGHLPAQASATILARRNARPALSTRGRVTCPLAYSCSTSRAWASSFLCPPQVRVRCLSAASPPEWSRMEGVVCSATQNCARSIC